MCLIVNDDSGKNLKCCTAPEQLTIRSGIPTAKIFKDLYQKVLWIQILKRPTKAAKWRCMPLLCVKGFIFMLSSQSHWYTYYDCIPVQIHASEENIVIARLQGKSFKKHWWHISKHAWYVLFSINTLGNICTLFMSHIWNTFYGATEMFSWKIEVNLNWPL